MTSRLFGAHGELCATHPWEVIVATMTLTACLLTVDRQQASTQEQPHLKPHRYCAGCLHEVSDGKIFF